MRQPKRLAVLALAGLLFSAAPAWGHEPALVAQMSADQEVPNPGPAGGMGSVVVVVDAGAGQVCFRNLVYGGIGAVTMGHIHRGPARVAGPVVVNLNLAPDRHEGCVPADPAVAGEIVGAPAEFYVNLHTTDFPAGAIRGQLQPAP
jgi:CHRD domain-containing protein